MPRKKKQPATPPPVETAVEMKPVRVTVTRKHCETPHAVELRKKDGLVVDARTVDFAAIETIGAKTVEHIFAEAGCPIPAGGEELEIVISPHNGAVTVIEPKKAE